MPRERISLFALLLEDSKDRWMVDGRGDDDDIAVRTDGVCNLFRDFFDVDLTVFEQPET